MSEDREGVCEVAHCRAPSWNEVPRVPVDLSKQRNCVLLSQHGPSEECAQGDGGHHIADERGGADSHLDQRYMYKWGTIYMYVYCVMHIQCTCICVVV